MNTPNPILTVEGVSLPSTLALMQQFRSITAGRDLVDEGEQPPPAWDVPSPRLLVKDSDGQVYSVNGNDSGFEFQPVVDGTTPSDDADDQPPPQSKPAKKEPPDFWDRQAGMLISKAKSVGMDYLSTAMKSAWNDPSLGSVMDGCFGKGKDHFDSLMDPDKLMSLGIGEATGFIANELMNLWEVDDKSPAGEQIAKQLVSQYLVEAVRKEAAEFLEGMVGLTPKPEGDSSLDLIKKAFDTTDCFLAAKSTDASSHEGLLTGLAVRTEILGFPAVRATDTHACGSHTPNKVAQGNPTILIEGLLASRLDHLTVCTAKIEKVSGSVYYGKATKDVLPTEKPKPKAAPPPAKLPPPKPPAAKAKAPAKKPPKPYDDEATPEGTDEVDNTYPGANPSPNSAPNTKDQFQQWWNSLGPEVRAELSGDGSMLTAEQRKWGAEADWNAMDPMDFEGRKEFLRKHPEIKIDLEARATPPGASGSKTGHMFIVVSLRDDEDQPFGEPRPYGFHSAQVDANGNMTISDPSDIPAFLYNFNGEVLNDLQVNPNRLVDPYLGFQIPNISVDQLGGVYDTFAAYANRAYMPLGGFGDYGSNCVNLVTDVLKQFNVNIPPNPFGLVGNTPIIQMGLILAANPGLQAQSNAPEKVWKALETLYNTNAAALAQGLDQAMNAMSRIQQSFPGLFYVAKGAVSFVERAYDLASIAASPTPVDMAKTAVKVVAEPYAAYTGGVLVGSAGVMICSPFPPAIPVCGGVGFFAGALGGIKISDTAIDGVFLNAEDIYKQWTTPAEPEIDTRELYPMMSQGEEAALSEKKYQEYLSQ